MSNGSDVQLLDSDPRRRGFGVPSGRGDTSRADRHHEQLLLTIEAVRHKAADTCFHNGTVYVNLYQNAATDS